MFIPVAMSDVPEGPERIANDAYRSVDILLRGFSARIGYAAHTSEPIAKKMMEGTLNGLAFGIAHFFAHVGGRPMQDLFMEYVKTATEFIYEAEKGEKNG